MIKVILRKGREESVLRFHPWVFSGAVAEIQGNPAEGDVVGVYSYDGRFLAAGHYQIGSIAVRILSFDENFNDPDFWKIMISRALNVRVAASLAMHGSLGPVSDPVGHPAVTDCYRLVHGEGDNLPGLVIDYYDGVCVMQAHSVGMFRSRRQICDALLAVYGDGLKAVYDKSSATVPFKAGLDPVDGYLYRKAGFDDAGFAVRENGHGFIIDWTEGQKTGFFLDQRENRAMVEKYADGRNVLNLFCYTGGFSIYALAGGASSVVSVDSSRKAMALVDRNIALNGYAADRHTSLCCDAMEYLKTVPEGKYALRAFFKAPRCLANSGVCQAPGRLEECPQGISASECRSHFQSRFRGARFHFQLLPGGRQGSICACGLFGCGADRKKRPYSGPSQSAG